jgi:hypothetical protein
MFDKALTEKIKVMAQVRVPRRIAERHAAVFDELLSKVDRYGRRYNVAAWLALYNFKLAADGPQAALEFIRGYGHVIPLDALLVIEERYFALTDSDALFEKRLLELLDRDGAGAAIRARLVGHYLRTGQLAQAIDLLRSLVGRAEGQAGALLRYSLRLGCWNEARAFLQECGQANVGDRLFARKASLEIDAAARRVAGALPSGHCFINLRRSTGRREGVRARWRALGIEAQFVDAVDGVEMSAGEYELWCPSARREPGSVGNGLSHLGAWRRLLETNEPHAFVFEDDAWPFADLAIGADLGGLIASCAADLLFVNERACYRWWEQEPRGFRPLALALASAESEQRAIGTDGYLVTRAGARKLIDNYEQDRVFSPTDWQMVLYCLTAAEVEHLPEGFARRTLTRNAALRKSTGAITAAVLNLPLVTQAITGLSTVGATNTLAARA